MDETYVFVFILLSNIERKTNDERKDEMNK